MSEIPRLYRLILTGYRPSYMFQAIVMSPECFVAPFTLNDHVYHVFSVHVFPKSGELFSLSFGFILLHPMKIKPARTETRSDFFEMISVVFEKWTSESLLWALRSTSSFL